MGGKKELCSKYLEISMTSEPGVIVENSNDEAESGNRDFGHYLKILLSAKVEIIIVRWGKHVLTLQNWSFPVKFPIVVACLHTGMCEQAI